MSRKQKKIGSDSRLPGLVGVLGGLVLLGIIAYANSFDVPFVFDDLLTVQRNTAVRFFEFNWNLLSGRALLYLTFTLNSLWTQQDVWSYHLVNLFFHLVNAVLLFFIAEHIFRRVKPDERSARIMAFIAAGFFLLHPVQTESVTYISSRSELLSLIFYLAGFLAFIKWPAKKIGLLLNLVIAVPFLFALSSKETAISLPAVLFLYDLIFLSGATFRPMLARWRFYLPFLAGGVGAAYYIGTVTLRGSIGSTPVGHLSSLHYFLTELRVLVRYVYLTFIPIGLNLDYDFRPSFSPMEFKVIASFIFLTAILVLGWILRKSQPFLSFSIFWFFLTLAPTSSVVPILDVIFEHRLYLPLSGVCISIPILLELFSTKLNEWTGVPRWSNGYAALLLGVFTMGTIARNHTWRDDVRLYEDVVAKAPYRVRGYTGLAWSLFKKGEYERAIGTMKTAMAMLPEQQNEFIDTLGNLYLKTRRYDDAVELFKNAVERRKGDPDKLGMTYNNLGVTYLYKWNDLKGRARQMPEAQFNAEAAKILPPAREAFLNAVQVDPKMSWAVDSYINVSVDMGLANTLETSAVADLEKGEAFNPLYAIGKLAFLKDNWQRADEFFSRAEKIKGDDKLLFFNHAYALDKLGKQDEAIEKYLESIRQDPIFIEAHHNVAMIYMTQRKTREGIDHLLEVLRYDPNHGSANLNLAKLYVMQNDKASARKHLQTLMRNAPGDQGIVQVWQQLGL